MKFTAIIAGGIGLLLFIQKYYQIIPDSNPEYENVYRLFATENVPAELLRSIAIVESGENENSYNPNDPSYGLMQILWTGKNQLYVSGWPPQNTEELYVPSYNVKIGSQILDWNIKTYGFFRGIVSYNNWSGRSGNVPLKSYEYFLKVFTTYLRLKNAN